MQLQNPSLDTRLALADKSLFPRESGTKTKRFWLSLLKEGRENGSGRQPPFSMLGTERQGKQEKKDGQRHIEVR